MAIKIYYTQKVTVDGETKLSSTKSLEVEAYDQIEAKIPPKTDPGAPVEIDVQPMEKSGAVEFLLIKADRYLDNLKFQVGDGIQVALNTPHMFVKDAIKLLDNDKAPQKVKFTNEDDQNDVKVTIIVGRKAVV